MTDYTTTPRQTPPSPTPQAVRRPYQAPTLTPIGQLSTLLRGIAGSSPDAGNGKKSGPGPA
jgi:hypothetical protein